MVRIHASRHPARAPAGLRRGHGAAVMAAANSDAKVTPAVEGAPVEHDMLVELGPPANDVDPESFVSFVLIGEGDVIPPHLAGKPTRKHERVEGERTAGEYVAWHPSEAP